MEPRSSLLLSLRHMVRPCELSNQGLRWGRRVGPCSRILFIPNRSNCSGDHVLPSVHGPWLLRHSLCSAVICTSRGSGRQDSGEPRKCGNGECAGPCRDWEQGWDGIGWTWPFRGQVRNLRTLVHLGWCSDLSLLPHTTWELDRQPGLWEYFPISAHGDFSPAPEPLWPVLHRSPATPQIAR